MSAVLSNQSILKAMERGRVVIDPFQKENLATSSYDVTLGQYYFRECEPQPGITLYNPYSKTHVDRVWGNVCEAQPLKAHTDVLTLENIKPTDRVIFIRPGETILAHTREFVGGRDDVTTMMKARSSMGRSFIEVCKCAGWGDVGYTNRWTMEITNNSRFYSIPLVVGRRIAQIVFFETSPLVDDNTCYVEGSGKYQATRNLALLKESWSPTDMLPRMYRDREVLAEECARAQQHHIATK